jgi:hypothetical protein
MRPPWHPGCSRARPCRVPRNPSASALPCSQARPTAASVSGTRATWRSRCTRSPCMSSPPCAWSGLRRTRVRAPACRRPPCLQRARSIPLEGRTWPSSRLAAIAQLPTGCKWVCSMQCRTVTGCFHLAFIHPPINSPTRSTVASWHSAVGRRAGKRRRRPAHLHLGPEPDRRRRGGLAAPTAAHVPALWAPRRGEWNPFQGHSLLVILTFRVKSTSSCEAAVV